MPLVEVSNGEILDRYSILIIKQEMLPDQKDIIELDLSSIQEQVKPLLADTDIANVFAELRAINLRIWIAMQEIYDWVGEITTDYFSHVVAIIDENKERAVAKSEIDKLSGSKLREAKSFLDESQYRER